MCPLEQGNVGLDDHDQNIRPVGVSGIILHSQMPVSQECTSPSHTHVFELATAHSDFLHYR